MPVKGFSRPLTVATGVGTGASDAVATLPLSTRGTLQSITVQAANANQAPVYVTIIAGSVAVASQVIFSGWVRGNNYNTGDPMSWRGEMALDPAEDNQIFVGFRNDTGSSASILIAWTVRPSA